MAVAFKLTDLADNALLGKTAGGVPANTNIVAQFQGSRGMVTGNVQTDNSYPTGGYALSPAKFGLSTVEVALFEGSGGYKFVYNHATDKVQVFSAGETEVVNLTDLSALAPAAFLVLGLTS